MCILMGDFNAAINDSAKPFNKQAVKILEWEESGEIKILNDKQATGLQTNYAQAGHRVLWHKI